MNKFTIFIFGLGKLGSEHSHLKILSHLILSSQKLLYQLYHIILQYSQHSNFYFTIQHIKIIFLFNKIIYPKTQIKIKIQKLVREMIIDKVS